MEQGEVVFSIAGRDQGRFFAVIEVTDDKFVLIADGEYHTIEKPKKKKIKHLKSQEAVLEKIQTKLQSGTKIFDAELKSALRAFNGSL